ncbi:hypothetical protein B296_00053459 [Ensete ventricosum]|uniref:Uncharacterized protein n=1 Tax=Ensete ventricosum TaxID=4639 RepID=A0A426XGB5_ENSVE|nr:hypothetical protein B296_00053459 [Ensete ventricosum]
MSALARCSLPAVRGYCSSVDCCVYPDKLPVAIYQGSGGTVHRSATASAQTSLLSPTGRQLVGCRTVRGYLEVGSGEGRRLDVAES